MADTEYIIGLAELLDDLGQLPLTLRRTLIARALREGAEVIKAPIIATAPDDLNTPGNRIADNIEINVTEQTAEGAYAYIGPTKRGFMTGFLEFGTAFITSRPFIGPAFDSKVKEATAVVGETLGQSIEKALKKQGRGSTK